MHVNGLSEFHTDKFPVSLKILQSLWYRTAFYVCLGQLQAFNKNTATTC